MGKSTRAALVFSNDRDRNFFSRKRAVVDADVIYELAHATASDVPPEAS